MGMTCPDCYGCGEVIQVVVVIDPDTGVASTREEAGTCTGCGGDGEV